MTSESGCIKENRPWMVGFDENVSSFYVFRPDCKCWDCPRCAARLAARWKARTFEGIASYIAQGWDFKFVTLTSHERLYSTSQTLYVWPKAWDKLRKRVSRICTHWFWVLIPEQHKDGRLHVHMISSADLGTRWWKDNGRQCGLGYRAEEEEFRAGRSDPERAAAYAGKYLGKQLEIKQWPRYFHRIRTSRHFPDLPDPDPNPFADIAWSAMNTAQMLAWMAWRNRLDEHVFYPATGERIL